MKRGLFAAIATVFTACYDSAMRRREAFWMGTKDLLVIIVIMAIIIAGFYIVLRMGIDFSEVLPDTMSHASV